jgi:HlyD family secretion protein
MNSTGSINNKELPMKSLGCHVAARTALFMVLGVGWALNGIMATRGAPIQTAPTQTTPEKMATKADGKPATPLATPSTPGKPGTAKAEKGPIKVEVVLQGVFESDRMTEVSIRPKAWAMPLVIESALELGTPVKKGDILVELDRSKIDKAIDDAEVESTLATLALKHAEEELPILEKSLPVDLAAADRSKAQADQDLQKFLEIDRTHSERNAHFSVKRSVEYLEYAKEELRQLEKMYRSKDLTEETEEIILRRTRFQVEQSDFFRKEAELQRDQTLKVDLPRQEERLRESAVKLAIDLEKARSLLPLSVNQKRLALTKLKHDNARLAEKLADLRQDRSNMTVHAPADGLVYYGRCERGHWSPASVAARLHKGGVIMSDEVFMTIVSPRSLAVRATVDEKDLANLTGPKELKGVVIPASDPDRRLPARLTSILPVPRDAGKFEATVAVDLDPDQAAIKPGMACTIKLVPYRNDDALTVPATAVFEDESGDSFYRFVYLARPDQSGKHPQRRIKTGKTAHDKIEVLDGLSLHEEILTSKP